MIIARGIHKHFELAKPKTGRFSSIRSLFSREKRIVHAVHDISFEIGKGEAVGYIGPNGAGKSTTIKMLSGILHPERQRRKLAHQIGVVFGQRTQLWWDLPVRDSFEIIKEMYKVGEAQYRSRLLQYDDLLHIEEFIDTPVRKLSLGQRMRADLVAALLHNPDVLFLDEPTIGLDVVAKTNIRTFLQQINKQEQKTILLTTHDMDDIESICSRVMIINHGTIISDGSIDQLREQIGLPSMLQVEYKTTPQPFPLPAGVTYELIDKQVTFLYDKRLVTAIDLITSVGKWGEVGDISMHEAEVEELIRKVYERPLTII
ncbi:ATP-binding cassette domain-containing protein [Brevibacillus sp. 7WMA2]|uniref:ABC transporter ATP-binding protein n=1 Tax=Brevibacillus sp. 7WMA2 TaxID=2683193 RepID=UPI0013A79F52|nr:ATP-binding cassette domain-containing protein [Brevibacillus sp. 7WMA2]QIC07412.1 ATP-binding cassette domain-containing protein [Brevibacillus sp. 7WMA2]